MGLEVLRSNNTRCPSALVFGLFSVCLFLLCNWWSLSTQNAELLKQIDNLAEQLKVNGEELGKCSQQRTILDEKLKDSQNRYVQQQIKIAQAKEAEDEAKESYQKIDTELKENKKKCESVEKSLEMCHTEMESLKKLGKSKDKILETLRTEKESLKSELVQKYEKVTELEKKINSAQGKLSENKFNQPIVKNLEEKVKKMQQNMVNNNKQEQGPNGHQYSEEKDGEEAKNYVDTGLLSVDNDPREQEMRAP